MSKFEWQSFRGGYDDFAVSKEKFTFDEAIKIAKRELCNLCRDDTGYLAIGNCFCRYRYGRLDDGEPTSGWWLEYEYHSRSVECWCFHLSPTKDENFSKDYKYIKLEEIKNV